MHFLGWSDNEDAEVHVTFSMKTESIGALGDTFLEIDNDTTVDTLDSLAHLFDSIE